jgi:tetratricopeptide (TPR) repeat protein
MSPIVLVLVATLAQATAGVPPYANADFPPFDRGAWELQRSARMVGAAQRGLRDAPDTVETLELLIDVKRIDEALIVLGRIVAQHPERMARAFEGVSRGSTWFGDHGHDYDKRLQQLVDTARGRLRELAREDAARTERQLLMVDRTPMPDTSFRQRLERFVADYRGTEAALLTEVDIILNGRASVQQLESLDAFARAHPRSVAGAKALHQKAFQLAVNIPISGVEPRTADPTPRFLQILDIVRQLEEGGFPPCEWVEKAPGLVRSFFTSSTVFAPGNIDRMLDAYYAFARTHFVVDGASPFLAGSGGIVLGGMAKLFELRGDGVAGVERTLANLERDVTDTSGVVYLRALLYMSRLNSRTLFYLGTTTTVSESERRRLLLNAIASLDSLSQHEGPYQRRALATLASLHFEQRQYADARRRYASYLARFPASDYAWLAALRIGQCDEALGHARGAIAAYRAAAAAYRSEPLVPILGHAAAGRLFEAAMQWDAARAEYERAAAAWAPAYRDDLAITWTSMSSGRDAAPVKDLFVSRAAVFRRIDELTRSRTADGGALFERARWLLEQRRWRDARAAFERFIAEHPRSTLVADARYLSHLARLEHAMHLASTSTPDVDEPAAVAELDRLIGEPYDFVVFAAKLASASMALTQGATEDAEKRLRGAFDEWIARQGQRQPPASRDPLAADVSAIRNAVFWPSGNGPAGDAAAARFRSSRPVYLVVRSEIQVSTAPDSTVTVSIPDAIPGFDNVLYATAAQLDVLKRISEKLGMRGDDPQRGGVSRLVGWWTRFFERGVSWGNVNVETYPVIYQIEFIDRDRTLANALLRTSDSHGERIVLQKTGGVWKILRVVDQWVS